VRLYWAGVAAYSGRAGAAIRDKSKSHRLRPRRKSDEEEHVKKIGFLTLLMTATLLLMLAFPAAAAGPKPAAPAPAVVVAPPAPANAAPTPDRHPHIDEALEAMRNAKHQLEIAEHDFDGHRAKSLEHLNAAIHEAEVCQAMR
jgi:hypothetical protein